MTAVGQRISLVRSGRRRSVARRVLALWFVLAGLSAAGVPVYVHPQIDPLRQADAVLVIGGYGWGRYPTGIDLVKHGWAPTLALSAPNGSADPWLYKYCHTPNDDRFELICFSPDPSTTRGEGRELKRLAVEQNWQTVIVVTFRPHISRARFILARCFHGDLVMVENPVDIPAYRWVYEFVYQTAGYIRALLEPSC